MSIIDWIVFSVTILCIIAYGIWKSRGTNTISGYFLADRKLPWYHVGLSVMATQASAITYLSAPGQAYSDGIRFVQFYFGLPLAMIFLCIFFLPGFKKWNVFTAYEYLEDRFDNKTRSLTALLFLLQRGISTGITIYAPSIILSSILGIDIYYVIICTGVMVVGYTVFGGTKAVSYTQKLQMGVIFASLFIVFYQLIRFLPEGVTLGDSLHLAGKMGKLNAIDLTFDLNNKYNIWSGIIGGFFLQLSYFGTDQSQVGRYLTGKSVDESRLGLMMNGLIKIPMQFFILLLGVMVFAFYQFHTPPMYFNERQEEKILLSPLKSQYQQVATEYNAVQTEKKEPIRAMLQAMQVEDKAGMEQAGNQLQLLETKAKTVKSKAVHLLADSGLTSDADDTNYIFLYFITKTLPIGIIGLLMAVILLAAMGATAGGLSALTSTTVMDFLRRFGKGPVTNDLKSSRWTTIAWGAFCILVALYAGRMGNLIEAVNILGSLFYGVILGIFVTAFFLKKISGNAVFYAAILAEIFVVISWWLELTAFLWLNLIGCLLVLFFAFLIQLIFHGKAKRDLPPV